jgi:hypothetical protein
MTSKTRKNSKNGSYYVSDGTNTIILSTREIKREKYIKRERHQKSFKPTYDDIYYYHEVRKTMTLEEYLDKKNVLHTIYRFYLNIILNELQFIPIELDNITYDMSDLYCKKQYYCKKRYNHHIWNDMHHNLWKNNFICPHCDLDTIYKNILNYYCKYIYDNTTNEKIHIKRLPDIYSNLNYINYKNNVINRLSKKNYILNNKFYWKYVYLNKMWIIKFYPNLHDDIGYLIEKICKMDATILNECIKNETYNLFYLISIMPIDIRNIIKNYL